MKRSLSTVFFILLPLLVACTSAGASSPANKPASSSAATQQLTVKSLDTLKFDPATLNAKAGQPIQITLDNSGSQLVHDFSISSGASQPVAITAQPGQRATGTFTIDKPGAYTYVCTQPGHEQAGMKGTLTVQ